MKVLQRTPIAAAAQIALLAVGSFGIAEPAAAQQPSQAQVSAIRSACRSDYQSHCASVPTGGAAALQCLQKNVASLSPRCQQAVNAVGGGAPAVATPTAPAAPAAPTPPTAPVTAAPAAPVTAAPAAPAPAAKSAATKRPSKAQAAAIRSACRADYQSYCRGVPPGGTAAWSCLQANAASFSPPCQRAVYAVTGGTPTEAAAPPAGAPPAAVPVRPPIGRVVSLREELFVIRTACGGDFRAYCAGVRLGGGRAIGCLEANAASLSPSCQGALGALRR
jgi:hypothetical protein